MRGKKNKDRDDNRKEIKWKREWRHEAQEGKQK
jgi:hypothetical protein